MLLVLSPLDMAYAKLLRPELKHAHTHIQRNRACREGSVRETVVGIN